MQGMGARYMLGMTTLDLQALCVKLATRQAGSLYKQPAPARSTPGDRVRLAATSPARSSASRGTALRGGARCRGSGLPVSGLPFPSGNPTGPPGARGGLRTADQLVALTGRRELKIRHGFRSTSSRGACYHRAPELECTGRVADGVPDEPAAVRPETPCTA